MRSSHAPGDRSAAVEEARLELLREYEILDTAPEERFDRITRTAASVFGVPIALISLVDEARQWFKSAVGLQACETGRDVAFCSHTIQNDCVMQVPDATLDERFWDNPLVTGDPNIRFYAGAPLITPSGHRLGTLCIIDDKPRQLAPSELEILADLAGIVVEALEGRRQQMRIARDMARAKVAEDELVQSREQLALAIEGGDLGLWDANFETRVVRFSPRWAEMLGYGKEEREESFDAWDALVHPEDLKRLRATRDAYFAGDSTAYSAEIRMRHSRGDWRWIVSKGKIFERNAKGEPRRVVGTHMDITSRKRGELALIEQNRHLELAEQVADIGHWRIDLADQSIFWSEGIYEIHGVTPDSYQPELVSAIEFYHPEDRPHVEHAVGRALEEQRPFEFDLRIVRPGGEIRHVRSKGECYPGENGEPGTMFGIFQDVTQETIAAARLEESEEKTRAVLENIVDGVMTVDERGLIDSCNPSCARIFGYSAAELVGLPAMELIPEAHRAEHEAAIVRCLATGEPRLIGRTLDLEGLRNGGGIFPVELTINQIEVGSRILFSGVVRDITERKAIERMKDEFVSTVSHELRTPLTSIYGSLGMLRKKAAGQLDETGLRLINLAHDGCEQLSALVNDILDQEKIAAGKMDYCLETVEFGQLVQDIVDFHGGLAKTQGVTFVTSIDFDALMVELDPGRFNQALSNLLSNAAEYSPEGEVVTIEAVSVADDKVRVSVSDRGPGIPATFHTRIFERFSQADSTTTRKGEGTGLGLSITKSIVEAFGGDISFDTAEGAGTSFHIVLPIEKAADGEIAPENERHQSGRLSA